MQIQAIIFSKDRAMQLDALLRSFFLHCTDASCVHITVLFKSSSQIHLNQYSHLAEQHPGIQFLPETDFRQDVLGILGRSRLPRPLEQLVFRVGNSARLNRVPGRIPAALTPGRFILFLVDDALFVQDFSIRQAAAALSASPEALGFSFRLGQNINYSYPQDRIAPQPFFSMCGKNILSYEWTSSSLEFNYPLEVSSSLYRVLDIAHLIDKLDFTNPNTLESRMAHKTKLFAKSRPNLLCFPRSCAFCNPINKVQNVMNNRAGESVSLDSESLSKLFDQGYRIDLSCFEGFIPNSCHQEVEFGYFKPEK